MDYLLNLSNKKIQVYLFNVLNLIINGLPSKREAISEGNKEGFEVLNLIINGLPSKLNLN